MQPHEAVSAFRQQLADLGLDEDHLAPWPTWKAFKLFLHREVEGVYDTASFQCEHDVGANDAVCFFVYLVRQFTVRSSGEGTATDDELHGRLVV